MMRGMKIATGKERTDLELHIRCSRGRGPRLAGITDAGYKAPRHKNARFAFRNEQLVLDHEIVDLVTSARPRVVFERFDSRCAVRMNYIRAVSLGRDAKGSTRRFHPCVEPVRKYHSPRRRRGCGQQQRVVTTRANSRDRSACEAAEAVRFEPFGVRINWIHHAQGNRSETAK